MKKQPSFGLDIEDNVLYGIGECTDKDIIIPDNVVAIEESAFSFCEFIESVIIPDSVQFIGEAAFEFCKNLTSVQIGCGVGIIERFAFYECEKLSTVLFESGSILTEIDDNAFNGCNSLKSLTLQQIVIIGDYAFSSCGLETIDFGHGLNTIGRYAFSYNKFSSIILPDSLESIGDFAFQCCSCVKKIFIPKSVKQIGKNPFFLIRQLEKLVVDENNEYFDSRANCNALIETKTNTIISAFRISTIPQTIKNIGPYAFCDVFTDKSIIIPKGIESIGKLAFSECYDVDEIFVPSSVKKIDDFAFQECNARRIKVDVKNKFYDSRNDCNAIIETKTNRMIVGCDATTIPDGVEIIGKFIFEGGQFDFSFKKFRIPQTVKTIEENAFESCYALKEIEYNGTPEQFSKLNNLPEDVKVTYFSKDWKQL